MRPEEITAVGDLAGEAASGLTSHIRAMHAGIAERVFKGVGAAGAPVRLAHDHIADQAYGTARLIAGALLRGGARTISLTRPEHPPSIDASARGRLAVGALNGVFGDALHRRSNELALKMTIRRERRDVDVSRAALAEAFPDATGRLVLFVHGLCETDDAWRLGTERHVPYGVRLHPELGYTPLYLRYNTGRHVSENGRELAALLEQLVDAWPVEADEIALIGHSMGGLVGRSACHYAVDHVWPSKVAHMFTLGTPHRGTSLEKAATATAAALARVPETRGFAQALNARSSGIQDLGHGYLVDEDWLHQEPGAFLKQAGSEIPFLSCANHYFVSATMSRELDAPVGRIVGDLLVLHPSAWGLARRGQRLRFPVEQYRHVGGANHFDLLNHPAIYEQICTWLTGRPALTEGEFVVAEDVEAVAPRAATGP
jgi:pimeloyl-ACP methyl ester carboxylesterase